jgi:DNA-binding NtrC family response regulator
VLHRSAHVNEYDLEPRFRGGTGGELPPAAASGAVSPSHASGPPAVNATAALSVEENEKRLFREALLQARGNRTQAAKLLGLSRRTLHRKLVQWPELDVIDR